MFASAVRHVISPKKLHAQIYLSAPPVIYDLPSRTRNQCDWISKSTIVLRQVAGALVGLATKNVALRDTWGVLLMRLHSLDVLIARVSYRPLLIKVTTMFSMLDASELSYAWNYFD